MEKDLDRDRIVGNALSVPIESNISLFCYTTWLYGDLEVPIIKKVFLTANDSIESVVDYLIGY